MKKNPKLKFENFNAGTFPIGKPIHWLRFNKSSWYLRNVSNRNEVFTKRLEEIIERSYSILINQISGKAIQIENEASFQLQFSYILKTLGELYKFSSNDLFSIELENSFSLKIPFVKSKSNKARIDIILSLGDYSNFATAAIELKFLKAINKKEPNYRYDVFLDLHNLETYKKENLFDITYFILGTDHNHYVNKPTYSDQTSDFDFRHGTKYSSKTKLKYSTSKPYGEDLFLENDYNFNWDFVKKQFEDNDDNLYFLKVKNS